MTAHELKGSALSPSACPAALRPVPLHSFLPVSDASPLLQANKQTNGICDVAVGVVYFFYFFILDFDFLYVMCAVSVL
jgi:hypothetical protein